MAGYVVMRVVRALVIEYFMVRERRSGNRILMAEFPWRNGGFRWSCGKLIAENQWRKSDKVGCLMKMSWTWLERTPTHCRILEDP